MKFVLPQLTDADRLKYLYYTEGAIQGILLIQSFTEDQLRQLTSKRDNKMTRDFREVMGGYTNPSWIRGRAAEELYRRDLVGEEEFDRLSDR